MKKYLIIGYTIIAITIKISSFIILTYMYYNIDLINKEYYIIWLIS